ncbi:YDG/SRA domain-containing protein [Colletotrichum graminicola]|uniref:YDG/SRA domain-containing protein n=1 Tax=Colletotrichum graminicola (strain M1.001 / M2 / FGSC 10212) TaxID=645133 RepID=E3QSC6_COLGM|nr:YDG/SRA domain-containing protein [Colletotrichum graminicola M1.001]EFQ33753.1 YDG/SRA domain-containing protein [Colletotrichum graminicola M1.001]WDK21019.1 YDG/SRA domain-containing protein [Colletotrichum graminicola]
MASNNKVPRLPHGRAPADYFNFVKARVLMPLGRLASTAVEETDPRVVEKVQEVMVFLKYVKSCRAAYPTAAPRELFNARYPLKMCLSMIFNPSPAAAKKQYLDAKAKSRAKSLHEWAGRVEDATRIANEQAALQRAQVMAEIQANPMKPNGSLRPPTNHPIWGRTGIMHGLALRPGDRYTVVLDPHCADEKRPANVHGHNGLQVGDWFPSQLSALFHGAHGHSNAGIYFQGEEGAFSVIVAGAYKDLDVDSGETVLYSGSNAHESNDRDNILPSTEATKALATNWVSGKPVRVLRKAHKDSEWAPSHGYRYDGLYEVVEKIFAHNDNNGMFEQFELRRLDGQPPLESLKNIPSQRQVRDLIKSKERY